MRLHVMNGDEGDAVLDAQVLGVVGADPENKIENVSGRIFVELIS